MADLKLDYTTWGCTVSEGMILEVTDAADEMRQRCAIAIKTHLGEYFLDTSRGLPWTSEILVKAPDLAQITSRARAYLMTIEGVTGVKTLTIALDSASRVMTWTLNVEFPEGVTGPFLVSVTL